VDISGISPTPHAACCPVRRFSEEENDVGCACLGLFRFARPLGIGHPGPPVGRRLPWLEANALPFPAGGGGLRAVHREGAKTQLNGGQQRKEEEEGAGV
jgi:hypothetical protein